MSFFRSQPVWALAIILAGCGTRAVTSSVSSGNEAADAAKKAEDVLTSAIHQLRPENFGINATTDKPVSLLNSWRFQQAELTEKTDEPTPVDAPSGWIAADEVTRLAQPKFDINDAIHIRDALFYHAIAGYLSDRARDEVQRVGIVVDFICRNVGLWKDDEIEILLPPFLTMQLGKGSADDRAWVCTEILRQLRIDSVILRSKKDSKEATDKWLLGVLIDKQIYLFDMLLGLPIQSGADEKGSSIATLAEIASHPEWLDRMSAHEPYRMKADDIRDSMVFVVSNSNFWSHRMQKLEHILPASDVCVLYDPLNDSELQAGLLHRITETRNWPIESLKQWGYPKRQVEASQHQTKESIEELQRLLVPFNVPFPVKIGEDGKPTIGNPERKLQRFRLDQLLGRFTEATHQYLSIRHLEVEPNPPELERINRMASEDAFYWTCQCKFELGEYDGAIEQLSAYLKKYDRKGKWFFPARLLLARSYAEQGQLPKAISTLERTSTDDPYRLANAIRVKRWSAVVQSK